LNSSSNIIRGHQIKEDEMGGDNTGEKRIQRQKSQKEETASERWEYKGG
jgi:hypothetical protein